MSRLFNTYYIIIINKRLRNVDVCLIVMKNTLHSLIRSISKVFIECFSRGVFWKETNLNKEGLQRKKPCIVSKVKLH